MTYGDFVRDCMKMALYKGGTYNIFVGKGRARRWELMWNDVKIIVDTERNQPTIIVGKTIYRSSWPLTYVYTKGHMEVEVANGETLVLT